MQDSVFNENVDYLYQVQTDLEAVEQLRQELAEYKNQEKNRNRGKVNSGRNCPDHPPA